MDTINEKKTKRLTNRFWTLEVGTKWSKKKKKEQLANTFANKLEIVNCKIQKLRKM